jgi:pimeloyl-ACP methyl ester carboxylesterase
MGDPRPRRAPSRDRAGPTAHGSTEAPDDALVLTWLGELIERTCASPPALVGHALGCAIGARFASEAGDRLSHLVLVDSLGLARFAPRSRLVTGARVTPGRRPTEKRVCCDACRIIAIHDSARAHQSTRPPGVAPARGEVVVDLPLAGRPLQTLDLKLAADSARPRAGPATARPR